MSTNPLNLGLRFLLEIVTLLAIGYWGWSTGSGSFRYLIAVGLPLLAAVVWGTFRVPGDSSASGEAPIRVPDFLRLLLELAFFTFAVWGLIASNQISLAITVGIAVTIHYAFSYDRILWLLRQ